MALEELAPETKRKDPVASIGSQMPGLTTGDRAALRRLYLTRSSAAEGVVIGLLHRAEVPEAEWREPAFARWQLLAHVAAVLSGTSGAAPHAPTASFGRALHAAGYSEHRLMRLTSARGAALEDQIVRAARYLAQDRQVPVDLWEVRNLLSVERAEAARLKIARDYYAAHHASGREDP